MGILTKPTLVTTHLPNYHYKLVQYKLVVGFAATAMVL